MSVKTIYIIPIEPIDQRYTKQWYDNIPKILEKKIVDNNLNYRVVNIPGSVVEDRTSTGAFLDFGATNVYKASQTVTVSKMFSTGEIKAGDKFLVTDAWNFIITPIKYMSDLLGIPVEIHSIWHAGAYDPSDILGYKMNKPWPWHTETGWFHSSDYNYYASENHRRMFLENLNIPAEYHCKAIRSGQPHELILTDLVKYQDTAKQDRVMWPHRYNADKQPEIAEDLSDSFDMVITQKMKLSKSDYYAQMGQSKAIFSCALHENLGISVMEAVLTGAIPVVPDRCSYTEMYLPEFKYPSEWTMNYEAYIANKQKLIEFIQEKITNFSKYTDLVKQQQTILINDYLDSRIMINKLLDIKEHST